MSNNLNQFGNSPDNPLQEFELDIRGAEAKLRQDWPDIDARQYLRSLAEHMSSKPATIKRGRMTATLTVDKRRSLQRMLDAIELSGPRQIVVHCRVIGAEVSIAREIDWVAGRVAAFTPNQRPGSNRWEQDPFDFLNDLPSPNLSFAIQSLDQITETRPLIATRISQRDATRLIDRCQSDRRANMVQAPKITLFNGQIAMISDYAVSPFVTNLIPAMDKLGELEPVIDVFTEGWNMHIHAVATADEALDLKFVLTESQIREVDTAELPIRSAQDPSRNAVVQIPHIARTQIRSSLRLLMGESLLIASPNPIHADGVHQPGMATFYLISATLLPHDQTLFSQ